jgi:hypothetical protein
LEPGQPTSQHGVHYIHGNVYFERLQLQKFLSLCFEKFDVAIWTCAAKRRTDAMVETIFTEEERNKFKFIWDQSYTSNTQVLRPDGRCDVMLKDLQKVWVHKFPDVYDDSNTILIDDSPLKTFVNPDFTTLYPTPFKFGDCEDVFLLQILWPLLEKLSCAIDVRRFLQINMPKWSSKNLKADMETNAETYAMMRNKFTVTKPSIPRYTLLDVSDYEITFHEKYLISKIPPKHHTSFTKDNIKRIVLVLLPVI